MMTLRPNDHARASGISGPMRAGWISCQRPGRNFQSSRICMPNFQSCSRTCRFSGPVHKQPNFRSGTCRSDFRSCVRRRRFGPLPRALWAQVEISSCPRGIKVQSCARSTNFKIRSCANSRFELLFAGRVQSLQIVAWIIGKVPQRMQKMSFETYKIFHYLYTKMKSQDRVQKKKNLVFKGNNLHPF